MSGSILVTIHSSSIWSEKIRNKKNRGVNMNRLKLLPLFLLLAILVAACSSQSSVSGEITFEGGAGIPDDATISVQIQDTSLADAPAEVIGEQVIDDAGDFPVAYEVSYDPDQIIDNHTYTMSARITGSDGSLLYINDTAIPVITNGNPTENVEIPVIQVGS
jgi:putative lipoprotein